MSSVNKVILVGNVGSDPEIRFLDRGVAIANFNLATTERGYTMQNGTQVPDRTEWHPIVLWRNLAEWAHKIRGDFWNRVNLSCIRTYYRHRNSLHLQ